MSSAIAGFMTGIRSKLGSQYLAQLDYEQTIFDGCRHVLLQLPYLLTPGMDPTISITLRNCNVCRRTFFSY